MKKSTLKLMSLIGLGLVTTLYSCSDDDDTTPNTANSNDNFLASQVDKLGTPDLGGFTIPSSYIVSGATSGTFAPAKYSGQNTRIEQLAQITAVLKDSPIQADLVDALQNGSNPLFTGDIFGTTTDIYTKIDELNFDNGDRSVADDFIALANTLVRTSNDNMGTASDGTAGILDGRHFSAKGLEYAQILEKGLYGPLFYNQMVDDYLRPVQAGAMNTNSQADNPDYAEEGTGRQHAWDEAFGYLGANPLTYPNSSNSSNGDGQFIANYTFDFSDETEAAFGVNLAEKAMDAFIFGRAVLKAGEGMTSLDESQNELYYEAARADVKLYVEAGLAAAAFHYLNDAIDDVDPADKLHHLSEALAFIYALTFNSEGRLTRAEGYEALGELGWGASNLTGVYDVDLWKVTDAQMEAARQKLNESFPGFADVDF